MSAHTKGPWLWRWKSNTLHVAGDNAPYAFGKLVLQLTDDDIADADAALVAAAPDLLDALEMAECWLSAALECESWSWDLDQHEAATESRDDARAAIAKARGE